MTLEKERALAKARARARIKSQRVQEVGQAMIDRPDERIAGAFEDAATIQPEVGRLRAAAEGFTQGATLGFGDEIGAAMDVPVAELLSGGAGESYSQNLATRRDALRLAREQRPGYTMAGDIGGAIATAPVLPIAAVAKGAGVGARVAAGMKTGAAYGGAYGVGAGEGVEDRILGGAVGTAGGAAAGLAAPLAVRAAQAAGGGIRNAAARIVSPVRGALSPKQEAARRVGLAMRARMPELTPDEEAAAFIGNQPILNIDRGGEMTRALGRSAANTSPQGRATLTQAVMDRFSSQGDRAMETVRRIAGGRTTVEAREVLQLRARKANKGAYDAAYAQGSKGLISPALEQLTSSPAVVAAMKAASVRGKDRAVAEGFGGFNAAVKVTDDGQVIFQKGKSGVPTYPDLKFWDYTKRELDDAANAARRAGRNEEATTLGELARNLRDELDSLVPAFGTARAGAARFFGAEDALSAGEAFISSRMGNDVARQALAKMTVPERDLFREGFADALVRKIAEVGDRRNVINSVFIGSKAARERVEMALGKQSADELEAFLRIEDIMDRARTAVSGNSTTARQLAELGLAGGAVGYGGYTGDMTTSGTILAALLARRGLARIDMNVAQKVAELLASSDPSVVQRGVAMVARNGKLLNALRRADIPAAAAGAQATTQALTGGAPLRVDLNAGERDRMVGGAVN